LEGEEMRPRRYPYSGKKESDFVKADNKIVLDSNKIVCGNIKAINLFGII
jgi:hypothetical protein